MIDLDLLAKQIDDLLESETEETMTKWLEEKRKEKDFVYDSYQGRKISNDPDDFQFYFIL